MAHIEYLTSIYDVRHRSVADVGAGDGTFSRQLHEHGALVQGIEIDAGKIDVARKQLPSDISLSVGRAEDLPLDSASQDLVCFFFSFHHVPADAQEAALAEAVRVLKPGGRLHVVEPFPNGPMFDVVRFVEDETDVRTNSHRIMNGLGERRAFRRVAGTEYTLTRDYADFETFVTKIVRSDPDRMAIFPSVRDAMEAAFERAPRDETGAHVLDQPCAAYHFEVSGDR